MDEDTVVTDKGSPLTPPNGFPDADLPPVVICEDAQSSQGPVKDSNTKTDGLISRISDTSNDQVPLHDRISTSFRDTRGVRAYEEAAKQYDLSSGKHIVNKFVTLPGKPKFLPRDRRFSWPDVGYSIEPCSSCNFINENKPKGAPDLPCITTRYFNRCIFCICMNNQHSTCRVFHPTESASHLQQKRHWQWGTREKGGWQNGQSYEDMYDHATTYSQPRGSRSYSERLPYDRRNSRTYDQADNHSRRRSSRDDRESSPTRAEVRQAHTDNQSGRRSSRDDRENSLIRAGLSQVHISSSSNALLNDISIQSNTQSTSEANPNQMIHNNGVEHVTPDDSNVAHQENADNHKPTKRAEIVQIPSPKMDESMANNSFSTVDTKPMLESFTDDKLTLIKNCVQDLQTENMREREEKEQLREVVSQLQQRYNRKNKDMENLENTYKEMEEELEKVRESNKILEDSLKRAKEDAELKENQSMAEHEELLALRKKWDHFRKLAQDSDSE